MELIIEILISEAKNFSQIISAQNHTSLIGVTDGKAVGTYVEHLFQNYLSEKYTMTIGNSASGIDLPSINTDIKTTSCVQPQSSCPFKDARQKIFGLQITHCTFIEACRTGDYTLTALLRKMLSVDANKEDIISLLNDRNVPGDEITYNKLADEILSNPPQQGYLTISNALQWRLQYKRVIELNNSVEGVVNFVWQ